MSHFIGIALQQAVYDSLVADSALMSVINNVYDHLPKDASMPYAVITEVETQDNSTKTTHGQITTLTIETWSRERGKEESQTIVAKIYDVLHRADLTVSGYAVIDMRLTHTVIESMSVGTKYKCAVTLEIISETV